MPTIEEADVAIVNTCGFIRSAVEEALDTILQVAAEKKKGKLKRLFVAGCLVQRYGYKLRKELPEVDGWIGTGEIHRVGLLLDQEQKGEKLVRIGVPTFLADHTTPRALSTPFYTAYLKISEGCSHKCTYCIIPKLRGPFRSGLWILLSEKQSGWRTTVLKRLTWLPRIPPCMERIWSKGGRWRISWKSF